MKPEKLQKILAQAGLGSRRTVETWIAAGRITINGNVAKLGDRALLTDSIGIDGKPIKLHKEQPLRILLYHKPEGEICSRKDEQDHPSVFNHLPKLKSGRWISIGRLDLNTSGLLLFTNDGELAYRLMHPSYEIAREYAVRILGKVDKDMIQRLMKGVVLEDGEAHFETIIDAGGEGANHWYHVMLREGKNRIVRRLWESQNVTVSRLIRIRFGTISLPRYLRVGQWIELENETINELMRVVKL